MKRYVSTSFWDDEWVQTLNFTEKGLYLYLLTNSLTNIAGVYKLASRRIAFDTGLPDSEIEMMMGKFAAAGKAYRYGEYIVIPSWPHHQAISNPKVNKGIGRELENLPPEIIGFLKKVGYRYPLEGFASSENIHSEGFSSIDNTVSAEADGGAESGSDAEPPQQDGVSEEQSLFLRLWQTTKDADGMCIFPITATIERPNDWKRFWSVSPPTREQIETAFRNYADGINSGALERRFIPTSPDRFALKGGITRFQSPVGKGGVWANERAAAAEYEDCF